MDRGGVAFLGRGPYASLGAAAPCGLHHGGLGDPSNRVAQNLLLILNEVDNRLQEEMAAVEGISSTLREDKVAAVLPSRAGGGGRRAFRSIWSEARALPVLRLEAADAARSGHGVGGGAVPCGSSSSSSQAAWLQRVVQHPQQQGRGQGCHRQHACPSGDWDAAASPSSQPAAKAAAPYAGAAAAASPASSSWLLQPATSYKYLVGKPALQLDARAAGRPCWLSPCSLPPGHPLGGAATLGPAATEARLLRPPLDAPLAAHRGTSACGPRPRRSPMSVVACPEYRRALLGARSDPVPAHTLQEVFKNERIMGAAGAGSSPSSSEPDAALQSVLRLEPAVPRAPDTSPAASPPPPPTTSPATDGDPALAEHPEAALRSLHSADQDGVAGAEAEGGATWLVDAVHLLKEYYLKRAQLCLETSIAASRHQLVVPERDVCRRDVAVGEDAAVVATADRWVSTAEDAATTRADAATSPRASATTSPCRSAQTQTLPVLCQPVHRAGEYRWLATDAMQPDLTLYVSCFDEAAAVAADSKRRA